MWGSYSPAPNVMSLRIVPATQLGSIDRIMATSKVDAFSNANHTSAITPPRGFTQIDAALSDSNDSIKRHSLLTS